MPIKYHHIDMFGNNYEQTYSTWEIVKALQDKNNALCIENERLEHEIEMLKHKSSTKGLPSLLTKNAIMSKRG